MTREYTDLYCSLWECVDCRTKKNLSLCNPETGEPVYIETMLMLGFGDELADLLKRYDVFCDRCAQKPTRSAITNLKIRNRRAFVAPRVEEFFLYLAMENEELLEDEEEF